MDASAHTPESDAEEDGGRQLIAKLGPGLVTGAADDDPSGIATYSQAGAQFGLNMLWAVVITYPLMAAIQSVAARVGRVTGQGLAANVKKVFPVWVLAPLVLLLLVANTINISADLSAMGAAVRLVLPEPFDHLYTAGFGLLSLLLQIFIPYHRYVRLLKWLTLALLAYVAVVFMVKVPWSDVAVRTFLPEFTPNAASMTMVVAIFGTTISPYLFFWQSSQEVEEIENHTGERPLREAPAQAKKELRRIRYDTEIGMAFSNAVAFFIILTTGVTLHAAGVTHIETAAQAASALKPIAGDFAFGLFALGIIGTGLLAVPVLAGSAAYAVAESFGWREGLERKPREAVQFYTVVAIATLGGVMLDFFGVDPIKALFWAAVFNGLAAAPIMAVTMLVAARPAVMGRFCITPIQLVLGWLATVTMVVAGVAMFVI